MRLLTLRNIVKNSKIYKCKRALLVFPFFFLLRPPSYLHSVIMFALKVSALQILLFRICLYLASAAELRLYSKLSTGEASRTACFT